MHSVETSNPKAYAQFYNETMKLIKNNQKFTDMAETTRKLYKSDERTKGLSDYQINQEII